MADTTLVPQFCLTILTQAKVISSSKFCWLIYLVETQRRLVRAVKNRLANYHG